MSYIVINDDLRTMQIPSDIAILGVESDDDVNKIQFQMPKEYSGFDLSQFEARINYMNANGIGDIYIADDLAVDGENMTFTWLVGRNACAYKGNTKFIVCLKKFDGENVVQEFNTTVYDLPVLEGLETTEAVVQQNADIIEQILQMIQEAGGIDMSNYYTKAQTDAAIADAIPIALPNPQALTINGTSYDGSEPVEMTISASSEVLATAEGQIIHVIDAIPQAVQDLGLYDSNGSVIRSGLVAVANKNLFRIDLLDAQVISKGVTFTKNADGAITVAGTSTGTYAMTSCAIDKHCLVTGETYTLSSGKTAGYAYVQLILNYSDGSTDYIVARNSSRTFTISKDVESCTGSVQLTDSGVTLNEVVYPMLELDDHASAFVNNSYTQITYNGTTMPVLPDMISNVWSNSDNVASIKMDYEADSDLDKIDAFVRSAGTPAGSGGILGAKSDGNGTVTLVIG